MPLQLMSQGQVKGILTGMARRGEIPGDWEQTWPWAKQVSIAHQLSGRQLEAYESQLGRAQEWPTLGAEYGGPLAGSAADWYAREPGQAPTTMMAAMGQVTGWPTTPEGVFIGTTPGKALKRQRLAVQEYGTLTDRPIETSWLRPPGGEPTRGSVVQTAFMHGLPAGAGAVSPAFPEIGMPYTRQIPLTPGAEITAMARPGAYATRGGALELLKTTQGWATQPVNDWERVQLTGVPRKVPYSMPGKPEVTEAMEFPMMRYVPAQAATVSLKAGGIKAFLGTGYDPRAMGLGAGVEQILPWPKDVRQQYAGLLGTPYGRAWTQEYTGLPIPQSGVEWGTGLDPQLMAAGEAFIKAHTTMRTVQMPIHEQLLGRRQGDVWTEKWGPYWSQMPKGGRPEAMGGGVFNVPQRQPVLEAPFLSQYRREHIGRPFISGEELAQLSYFQPQTAQRLWQEGAGARQPYMEVFKSIQATREGRTMGATPIENLPWGRIHERARGMMEEELGYVKEGMRPPGQYLARAAAEMHQGPMLAQYGKQQLVLPSPETFARLGQPGPLGEEVTPLMTGFHRLAEQAAIGAMGWGGDPREMRKATRQTWTAMEKFARGPGVQREAMGTRPQGAWEGPVMAHTGLAAGQEIWGPEALSQATGLQGEQLEQLQEAIAKAGGLSGIATAGWRRPVSDPFGQIGGQGAKIMTEAMAREKGLAVSGLGRGIMVSPYAMFEQRGDVDADRIMRFMQDRLRWVGEQIKLPGLPEKFEQGVGTIRRIAGALRLHSPQETPEGGSPESQIWGSTAKWNEARSWMEEVQQMGGLEDVMQFYGQRGGQFATWKELASTAQLGLESKEMMGRTYNRFIRELRPLMTQTATGRRAFRQWAAGPYQRTIDVTRLSAGARGFLEKQEAVGMTPKGGGFGYAKIFSPYERTEEGKLRPQMGKFRGWGDIAVSTIGDIMGMEEMPAEARAYGIGGEKFHKQVLQMMQEGREPGEVLGAMGGTEMEAMRAAGPAVQSTLERMFAKIPEGKQTYTDWEGKQRTVQMPMWSEAPQWAQEIRERGIKKSLTGKLFSRKQALLPKTLSRVLSGENLFTPEQERVMGWVRQEMGIGAQAEAKIMGKLQAQTAVAPAPVMGGMRVSGGGGGPAVQGGYAAQVASDAPVVSDWNKQMEAEIAQRMAAMPAVAGGATGGPPSPPNWTSAAAPAPGGAGGGRGQGGGVGAPGYRTHIKQTLGPSGPSTQIWTEQMYARKGDVENLRGIQTAMGRAGPMVEASAKRIVDSFDALNKVVEEGRTLRKEEVQELKATTKQFDAWRKVAEEWERQAKPTYGMTGSQEFGELREQVRGTLGPMMGQVQQARALQREMEAMAGGMGPSGGGPQQEPGILGRGWAALQRGAGRAVGGWGAMALRRYWGMFGAPVQAAIGEYAGQQLQSQQAMYMAGLPTGMEGAPIEILQQRAQMAQFRAGMGQAGWQAWGGLTGIMGDRGGQPAQVAAAIGGPATAVGLGAAYLFGGPVGVAAGLGTAAIGAYGYATSAARDQEAIGLAAMGAAGTQGGLGGYWDYLKSNFRGLAGVMTRGYQEQSRQGAGVFENLARFGYGIGTGAVGFNQQDLIYGQQIRTGNLAQLRDPEGRLAAMQYFNQQVMAPMLPGAAPEQVGGLTAAYMGMTGQQVTSQFNTQLMQQAGERAMMLGLPMGQAFSEFTGMATQMGAMPGANLGLGIAQYALGMPNERARQQYMAQLGNVSGMVRGAQETFGITYGNEAFAPGGQWAELGAAGMGPERRRTEMMIGGNRQLWSDWGRSTGRTDLITMEAGGNPIYTSELRGLQDVGTQQARAYRDWQQQQQWDQMQATNQYQRATWGVQDQQRQLQAAQQGWQFGYQQRQFALAGQQWQQQFDVQGRQQMESMALGRQIFEARAGWQQQDFSSQAARQEQQYQWRMEDWTYGENRAQLSYGWQMEDLSESIRFATGRERRGLMKQQERATIGESMRRQHSLEQRDRMEEQRTWEEEDFQKSKARNEELIALQREQYEMQKRHWEEDRELAKKQHEENRAMQAERMEKEQEFYQENKRLSDDLYKLQREHAEEQMKWQEQAWKKQQEYTKLLDKNQDATRDLQREQQDVIANFQRMLVYTEELRSSFEAWQRSAAYEQPSEAASPTRTYSPRNLGGQSFQTGGVVKATGFVFAHAGERVDPTPNEPTRAMSEYEQRALRFFERLVQLAEGGKQSVVVVETNNAQKTAEHIPTLEDAAWGLMPG